MNYNDIFLKDGNTYLYTGKYIRKNEQKIKTWKTRVLGWDPAKKIDGSGIAIIDKCLDDVYRVIAVHELKGVDWMIQYKILEFLAVKFEIDYFAFDANGPGSQSEDVLKEYNPDGSLRYPTLGSIKMYPIYSHTKQFKYNIYKEIKKLMMDGRFKLQRGNTKLEDQFAALTINNLGSITHKKGTSIDIPSAILMGMSVYVDPDTNKRNSGGIFFIK